MNQTMLNVMGARKTADGWEKEWDAAKAEGLALAHAPPADHLPLPTSRTLAKGATGFIPREEG